MNDLQITCHGEKLEDGKCKVCGRKYDFLIEVKEPVIIVKTNWGKVIIEAIAKSFIVAIAFIVIFLLLVSQCSIK
jgi:hypothetical protein